MSRARTTDLHYGQYTSYLRNSRHPRNRRGDRLQSSAPRRDRAYSRSPGRSPMRYYEQRERSSGPLSRQRRGANTVEQTKNPSLRRQRFCYGCGSPHHLLSDNECTPTLEAIKTNIVKQLQCTTEVAEAVAEQIFNLSVARGPTELMLPRCNVEPAQQLQFQESMYVADEREKLETYVQTAIDDENLTLEHGTNFIRRGKIHDFSHVHFTSRPAHVKHAGFCVDIGAPKSVIGERQLHFILKKTRQNGIPRVKSVDVFKFGDIAVRSVGMIELHLKTPAPRRSIPVLMDIVPVDVPALLGLDVLDAECLYADNVTNRIVHRLVVSMPEDPLDYDDLWHMPLARFNGHLYAEICFPTTTFYTVRQLEKLHRQFAHPSAEKLFNLLKRAGTEPLDSSTYRSLEEIGARCEPCQRIGNAPRRFRVTMGQENLRFNAEALIDIMYIEGRRVLHIVDSATRFSAARFLPKLSTEAVWKAIIVCWSSVYTGLPHCMRVDDASQFRKIFAELSALHQVEIKKSGTEAHSSLGIGERYHKTLRDTYRKLKLDHPSVQRQVLLALSVKAMNDTLGPEGIVPSSLVFGEFPSLRSFNGPVIPCATLAERALVAQEARRLMSKHLAQTRVRRALKHQTPRASDVTHQPGDKVLVWREKLVESRIGEWIGPYVVRSYDAAARIVLVQAKPGASTERLNAVQVKPFLEPVSAANNHVKSVAAAFKSFANEPPNFPVQITELIDKNDPRANSDEMQQAKLNEVRDLLQRGTFKVILKSEIPDGANALTARFVLAIKSSVDGRIKYKARYVVGGHRDILKQYLVHGVQTLQASSTRLLIALASAFEFDVWSSDVKLAYLQSTEPLLRRVFITNPAQEFELEPSQCFELLKPLYGLSDAGDLWHITLHKHLTTDLRLIPTKCDASLYYSFRRGDLVGINDTYVDNLLRAGNEDFKELCKLTHEKFETSGDDILPLTFAGLSVSKKEDGSFAMDQTFYLQKLECLESTSTFESFRSMRMRVAWLANTRPDMQFGISQLAQVTQERFTENAAVHIKNLNSAVRYAHDNIPHLPFPKLDLQSLRIVGYSDAAFANNYDATSQLGRAILLIDDANRSIPIAFKSYMSRRVTRSVLSAEVIAFADLFDNAFAIRSQVEQALRRGVPMHLLTDSKSLFDIISKGSRTSEKRIMLDIHATRQGYQNREISNIGFVRSQHNLADGLTKPKMQGVLLETLLSGKHEVICEQWIIRSSPRR